MTRESGYLLFKFLKNSAIMVSRHSKGKMEELSIIAYKNGEIVFTSDKFGIFPAYIFYKKGLEFTDNCEIHDKVTGKGSAMLLSETGCRKIKTGLISQEAFRVLERKNIEIEYEEIVPYIINRTGDGKCPVEKIKYLIFRINRDKNNKNDII